MPVAALAQGGTVSDRTSIPKGTNFIRPDAVLHGRTGKSDSFSVNMYIGGSAPSAVLYVCRMGGPVVQGQKKRGSEVFDAERVPLFVLVTRRATETRRIGYNLPIASTNLKLLT